MRTNDEHLNSFFLLLQVNGILYRLPLNLNNGAVQVYQDGYNDVIITDFGLRVTYDLVYHVTITVPGSYFGRTCGLCGNFNDDEADEFQLPDGNLTKDFQTFGAAWTVPVPGVVCEDGCSGDQCPKCDVSKEAAIKAECSIISDTNGPFAACHGVIDPASYYQDCVYDVCMSTNEESMLCQSIVAYMSDCQSLGVNIGNWRNASFCRESAHFYYSLYTVIFNSTSGQSLLHTKIPITTNFLLFDYSFYMQCWQPLCHLCTPMYVFMSWSQGHCHMHNDLF